MTPGKSTGHVEITSYGVITADLVESSHLRDRTNAQKRLSRLVEVLNSRSAPSLAAKFMITLGDEIQGMFRQLSDIPRGVVNIHEEFRPQEIRVGIGIGRVTTPLSAKVTEMDGPVFVYARKAVEEAKKQTLEVVVRSRDERTDEILNAIYLLLEGIKARWTETQWHRVNLYRNLETFEGVARKLGVAKQSINKSLRNTLWHRILEVEATLPQAFSLLAASGNEGRAEVGPAGKRGRHPQGAGFPQSGTRGRLVVQTTMKRPEVTNGQTNTRCLSSLTGCRSRRVPQEQNG